MRKLLISAIGAAAVFGAPQIASAQFMAPGQPGWTTSNRTLPPGSPGLSPQNVPTPSPFSTAPIPSFAPSSPYIGQRGDLNRAEPEFAEPGERDESGRIGPTIDRQRARFAGERGPDGKLLPTHVPQQAQAPQSQQSAPQSEDRMRSGQSPTTPQMQREQAPGQRPLQPTRRPGSGAADQPTGTGSSSQMAPPPISEPQRSGTTSGQGTAQPQPGSGEPQTGQTGTSQQRRTTQPSADRQQSTRSGTVNQREMSETAALNALSAEGYTNIGRIERVGGNLQATAMKEGRQVTVSIDPETSTVREQ